MAIRAGLLFLFGVLTGPAWAQTASEPADPAALVDVKWWLSGVLDKPVIGEAWLTFDGVGGVSGNTGCNNFRGTAKFGESTIDFGPLISTRMACADSERMAQEDRILSILSGALSYTVEHGRLSIVQPSDGASLTFDQQQPQQQK